MLIVEDDPDIRLELAELVRLHGCDARTAVNGEDGLSQARADPPSLIILDLLMPVMDGWTLRSKLLADNELCRIPVAIVSATAEEARAAQSLVAVEYLAKPVDLAKLYSLVDQYC